jgi:hypothetical protein
MGLPQAARVLAGFELAESDFAKGPQGIGSDTMTLSRMGD